MDDELASFSDRLNACIQSLGSGKLGCDMDCVRGLVRHDRALAERWIQTHLFAAASQPGYLQWADIVAQAIELETGDGRLHREVVERANSLGSDTLGRVSPVEDPQALARLAARTWWEQQTKPSAQCDGCGDPILRGQGYLVEGFQYRLGDQLVDLGQELLCEECYLKRVALVSKDDPTDKLPAINSSLDPAELFEHVRTGAFTLADVRQYVAAVRGNYQRPDPSEPDFLDADSAWRNRITALHRYLVGNIRVINQAFRDGPSQDSLLLSRVSLILAELVDPRQESIQGFLLARQLRFLKDPSAAVNVLREARTKAYEAEDAQLLLDIWEEWVLLLKQNRDWDRALELAKEMAQVAQQGEYAGYQAKASYYEGTILRSQGKLAAVSAFEQALALRKRVSDEDARKEDVPGIEVFFEHLGDTHRGFANYDEAVSTYRAMADWARTAHLQLVEARATSEIGFTYDAIAHPSAATYLEEAARIAGEAGDTKTASRWRLQAAALREEPLPADLQLPTQTPGDNQEAYYQSTLANVLLASGHSDHAEPLLRQVKNWAEGHDQTLFVRVCNNLGICLSRLGRSQEAVPLFHRAIQIADFIAEWASCTTLRINLAQAFAESQQFELAFDVLESGIAFLGLHVDRPETTRFRQEILAGSLNLYTLWTTLHTRLAPTQAERLVRYTERVRARNLYAWARTEAELLRRDAHEVQPRIFQLLRDFRANHVETELAYEVDGGETSRLEELAGARQALKSQVDAALTTSGLPEASFGNLDDYDESKSLDELLGGTLDKRDVLISLFSTPDGICAAAVPGSDLEQGRSAWVEWTKQDRLHTLRQLAGDNDSPITRGKLVMSRPLVLSESSPIGSPGLGQAARSMAAALGHYESRLFRPLAELLDGLHPQRIVIVPHLDLSLIPYWRLADLLPSHPTITLVPSMGLYRICRERNRANERTALVIPDVSQTLSFAHWETEQVMGTLGDAAVCCQSHEEILRRGPTASIVHVAGHGIFSQDRPYHSGVISEATRHESEADAFSGFASWDNQQLVVSENPGDFRLLTVAECLGRLSLRSCRVAVLSSCESGISRQHGGGEMTGLPAAFLVAGAQSVIASLWKIDDAGTALTMKYFYEAWSAPGGFEAGAATALAEVRHRLKNTSREKAEEMLNTVALPPGQFPFAHPLYSDAFHCFGSP